MDKILICLVMLLCLSLSQNEVILHESLDGIVEAGNYTYFSYSGNYKISLFLKTIYGDADLYVSQADSMGRTVKPRFDLNGHDLQSVTCGEDRIDVPEDFLRPIGIAVYGHPSYDLSQFTLDVIAFDDNDGGDGDADDGASNLYISEDELKFYEEFFGEPYGGLNKVPKNRRNSVNSNKNNNNNSDPDESHSETWDFILGLLGNILHILLEAFL